MFFRSKKSELQKLTGAEKRDLERVEELQRELEASYPRWREAHEKAEGLALQILAHDMNGQLRGGHEPFIQRRLAELEAALNGAIAARDAITATAVEAIESTRARIQKRRSALADAFCNFAWEHAESLQKKASRRVVIGDIPPTPEEAGLKALAGELLAARQRIVSGNPTLQEIIDTAATWEKRLETTDPFERAVELAAAVE